ncbi:MFS general substrate transporter [Macrolepiota fuliginosa MF-IS2]|uniref:MFS general substrate transporter n=1 Tax=Macrolepiota fuliginosa MF-IS2 TaxID=1400762 RepID=A0A9P5XAB1_9AGAR|nr:MFS general substrate transporter [Macrolepiota fuliginosa MF-IS2]
MTTNIDQWDEMETTSDDFVNDKHVEAMLSSSRQVSSEAGGHDEILYTTARVDDWVTDPDNARNWSARRKWTTTAIVSLYTFLTPFASTLMAPGLPALAQKYHITNSTVSAMTLCIFLLANALGPLVLAPMSEMYGRTWVLHGGNLLSAIFHLACGFAPNVEVFITFRFLSGLSGGAPVACGAGSIGDLFTERDRASAMAIYSLGPLIGPIMGPIVGGVITERVGVKYLFIILASLCGFAALVGILLLKETYGPVLRYRKALNMGDEERAMALSYDIPGKGRNILLVVWLNLRRPVTLLCITFMMFTTFGRLFSNTYGFEPGVAGLAYLGLGVGFIIATIIGAKFSNRIYAHLAAKNGGKGKPEMRMPALFFGSFFIPIGLLWYGWSAQAKLHWIMPIIGSGIFGFGAMTNFLPIQLYLVDAFTYAASAVAASMVFRSLLGFTFPLFGQQMYNRLGIGYGNTLLALLGAVLGIPFPVWIYYYGERIRTRSPLTRST